MMRESSVYQMILKEGREEGQLTAARRMLLRIGGKCLGQPDETLRSAIETMEDLTRLEELMDRVVECRSWAEVFADGGA